MTGLGFALALAAAAPATPQPAPLSFDQRILAAHNAERVRLGSKPLVWSPELAAHARVWAEELARKNMFEHAPEKAGAPPEGENLWMGTARAYSPEQMVGSWTGERPLYKPGKFPNVSTSGKWEDVGHYTQLIWAKTTHIGCALVANRTDDYLVCRYSPPGNWIGEYALAPSVPLTKAQKRK